MSSRATRLQLLAILLLSFVLVLPAVFMRQKSATFDEVSHLPAGYSYWMTQSIQYNRQHPPFIKELCALPLLFMDVRRPGVFPESEWEFGKNFLFGQDANKLLFWGRVPAVLLSAALGILVMVWASKLWGKIGGLVALFLYAFDPTITAHSQLVTTDVGVAFFSTLYLWFLRGYLRKPSARILCLCGLTLGLALGSKFSAVVLLPVSVALITVAALTRHQGPKVSIGTVLPSRQDAENHASSKPTFSLLIQSLTGFGGILALASIFLWAMYFFPKDPWFYLEGIQRVNQDRGNNPNFYLMGTLKPAGSKIYLLVAWLVKTPMPSLVLQATAVVLFYRERRDAWLDEAFLAIPAAAYFALYSLFGHNIGVRYLIPCFPFLFVSAARVAKAFQQAHLLPKLVLASLLVWHGTEYFAITPDHLSYFNQIAGGPENGVEWLDDSNVDWGQGLIQLSRFIETNGIQDYAYMYFGTADPGYYGIRGRRIQGFDFFIRPTRGIIILSAHVIPRGRSVLDRTFGDGPLNWLRHEKPLHIVGHCYFVYNIQ